MDKAYLISAKERNVKVPELEYIFKTMEEFLQDVGMGFLLHDKGPEERIRFINRIHKALILNNPICPDNISINILYPDFMYCVAYGKVTLREKSVVGLIGAFKEWISNGDTMQRLHEKAGIEIPRTLPADPHRKLPLYLEDWEDSEIQRQISIIVKIGIKPKDLPGNANGYMTRLFTEAQRRNLKPTPIRL